jgi:hypothetical protein
MFAGFYSVDRPWEALQKQRRGLDYRQSVGIMPYTCIQERISKMLCEEHAVLTYWSNCENRGGGGFSSIPAGTVFEPTD